MTDYCRFAIYYLPPKGSALARFGADWLGWDIEAGTPRPQPGLAEIGPEFSDWTAIPAKYGFHATIKPPFRLAEGMGRAKLEEAFAKLCVLQSAVDVGGLRLARIGRFLALVPERGGGPLLTLAGNFVTGIDAFRAPPTKAEVARRQAAGLSAAQERLLARWGYPYVLEEFRFHMTLTAKLDAEARARAGIAVEKRLPQVSGSFVLGEMALVGERSDSRFEEIHRRSFPA